MTLANVTATQMNGTSSNHTNATHAFSNNSLPLETTADSSSSHNATVQSYESAQTDVGIEFRMVFEIIFYVCVVRICMYTFSYMVNQNLRRGLSTLQQLAAIISFFTLFYGFYVRVTPRGRGCSDKFGEETDQDSGYLIQQGLFFKWGLVFVAVMIILSLIMTICGVIFHKKAATNEER